MNPLEPALEAYGLSKVYPRRRGDRAGREVHALRDVSVSVRPGETLAIVGESGSGKSTLARCLVGALNPTSGVVKVDGKVMWQSKASVDDRRRVQMVFQNATAALNPRMRVNQLVGEAIRCHGLRPKAEVAQRVDELLALVGLNQALGARYPHQLSGGQRQRVGIARTLGLEPSVLVCDEPVSSLDVSVQAQILNLLLDLQKELGLTYIFISHDLGVVRQVADDVAVMYAGRVVEHARCETLYQSPEHPYTQLLLSCAPSPDPRVRSKTTPRDQRPEQPKDEGCSFYPRCPNAHEVCAHSGPSLDELGEGHRVACHYPGSTSRASSALGADEIAGAVARDRARPATAELARLTRHRGSADQRPRPGLIRSRADAHERSPNGR